jgi:GxxExxY protein
MRSINELCDIVRETSFAIHVYHRQGHREEIYENALVHRLRKAGLEVKQQCPLKVYDEDGTTIGEEGADLVGENCLLVDVITASTYADEDVTHLIGLLRSARVEDGLLINFGSFKFQVKRTRYAAAEQRSTPDSSRIPAPEPARVPPAAPRPANPLPRNSNPPQARPRPA